MHASLAFHPQACAPIPVPGAAHAPPPRTVGIAFSKEGLYVVNILGH